MALSSAEAEYIALSSCTTECIFIKQLLESLLLKTVSPIVVYEDNQSAIKIASTLETKRSKHIDVRYHFIRNYIFDQTIELRYIKTSEQCADMLTKALPVVKFEYHRQKLGLTEFEM